MKCCITYLIVYARILRVVIVVVIVVVFGIGVVAMMVRYFIR